LVGVVASWCRGRAETKNKNKKLSSILPPSLPPSLQGYFEAIRQNPFQYHHNTDDLAEVFFNPDYQGYLTKQGQSYPCLALGW